jgi:hypothetical protein
MRKRTRFNIGDIIEECILPDPEIGLLETEYDYFLIVNRYYDVYYKPKRAHRWGRKRYTTKWKWKRVKKHCFYYTLKNLVTGEITNFQASLIDKILTKRIA